MADTDYDVIVVGAGNAAACAALAAQDAGADRIVMLERLNLDAGKRDAVCADLWPPSIQN